MIISLYIIIIALMLADEATTVNKEDALSEVSYMCLRSVLLCQ